MNARNYYIVRVERDSFVEHEFVFLSKQRAERYRNTISKGYPGGEWRECEDGTREYEFDRTRGRGSCDWAYAGAIKLLTVRGENK